MVIEVGLAGGGCTGPGSLGRRRCLAEGPRLPGKGGVRPQVQVSGLAGSASGIQAYSWGCLFPRPRGVGRKRGPACMCAGGAEFPGVVSLGVLVGAGESFTAPLGAGPGAGRSEYLEGSGEAQKLSVILVILPRWMGGSRAVFSLGMRFPPPALPSQPLLGLTSSIY